MAQIAVKPILLNDVDLLLGADNYEAHVSKAELVPNTPTAKFKGMTPSSSKNVVGTPDWMFNIDHAQDHETALALSLYLLANVGKEVTVKMKPKKPASPATAAMYTFTIVVVPGSIGGAVDTVATSSVSLPVDGQPVRSVA